jgi:AraC-like DNA-binding protein
MREDGGDMTLENVDMGKNVTLVCKDAQCAVFSVKDKTGEGTMTMYDIFPGVAAQYNDFHMERCISAFHPNKDMLCIDHCREGRIEREIPGSGYVYCESGDMQIDDREHHSGTFSFPLSHYHGMTIVFMLDEAESLSHILEGLTFDIPAMKQKFCPENRPFIVRASANIEHIFSELYALPEQTRIQYLKVKVLELLLFLNMLEKPEGGEERPYFYKNQVDKVKAIHAFLTENLNRRYTLEELSERFELPLTAMKLCFRGVYGDSVYAYMKSYRMNAAAMMLRQSGDNVCDIANRMGYENAAKFTTAFKSVKGVTPAEYRKSAV